MFNYPLAISFHRFTRGRKIDVLDVAQHIVLQVRKHPLALRTTMDIYCPPNTPAPLYQIRVTTDAEAYSITDAAGATLGGLTRCGMKSRWRAAWDTIADVRQAGLDLNRITSIWNVTYTILNPEGQEVGQILEKIPLLKIVGWILEEFIPARPFLNPRYQVTYGGKPALYTRKLPELLSRTFTVEKRDDFPPAAEGLLLSSLVMALIIERKRGI